MCAKIIWLSFNQRCLKSKLNAANNHWYDVNKAFENKYDGLIRFAINWCFCFSSIFSFSLLMISIRRRRRREKNKNKYTNVSDIHYINRNGLFKYRIEIHEKSLSILHIILENPNQNLIALIWKWLNSWTFFYDVFSGPIPCHCRWFIC